MSAALLSRESQRLLVGRWTAEVARYPVAVVRAAGADLSPAVTAPRAMHLELAEFGLDAGRLFNSLGHFRPFIRLWSGLALPVRVRTLRVWAGLVMAGAFLVVGHPLAAETPVAAQNNGSH